MTFPGTKFLKGRGIAVDLNMKCVKPAFVVMSFFVVLAAVTGCGGGGGDSGGNVPETSTSTVRVVACPASGTTDVLIVSMTDGYLPAVVTVPVDGTVKWSNIDSIQHNVASTNVPLNGEFNEIVNPGASVCLRFTSKGTFNYHRSFHPSMPGGVVIVQ